MDIETRLTNLENLVNALIEGINNSKFYTDADIAGVRQNIAEVNQEMFPEWDPNSYDYFAGEKVTYNGKYYRCVQSHTSQPTWSPEDAKSLWAEIGNPSEEYPEWIQPTGAQDAYEKGAKVSHNDKHWISEYDANVWEPGVFGWAES